MVAGRWFCQWTKEQEWRAGREHNLHPGLVRAFVLDTCGWRHRGTTALAVCRQLGCRCGENIELRMTTGMLICPLGSCPLFMVMCFYELNVCSPSPTPSLIHHPSHPKNSYLEASNPRVMGVGVFYSYKIATFSFLKQWNYLLSGRLLFYLSSLTEDFAHRGF